MSEKNSWESMVSDVGSVVSSIVWGIVIALVGLPALAFILIKLFG